MRQKHKQLAILAAIPVLGIGWAAFRPELLFVNHTVNESLSNTDASQQKTVSTGNFVSYAHETSGTAMVIDLKGRKVLRLTNFKTSNGPDVHVIISKTTDPKSFDAQSGIDLGVIKGNQGDQNYDLPAMAIADEFKSVTIWCKRFAVSFGGAMLDQPKATQPSAQVRNSIESVGQEIRVTSGKLRLSGKILGNSELIERDGSRFLRIRGFRAAPGVKAEVYLAKVETLPKEFNLNKIEKIKSGTVPTNKSENLFKISKDIDAWLFRSVVIWDANKSKVLATSSLRSDQEMMPR